MGPTYWKHKNPGDSHESDMGNKHTRVLAILEITLWTGIWTCCDCGSSYRWVAHVHVHDSIVTVCTSYRHKSEQYSSSGDRETLRKTLHKLQF